MSVLNFFFRLSCTRYFQKKRWNYVLSWELVLNALTFGRIFLSIAGSTVYNIAFSAVPTSVLHIVAACFDWTFWFIQTNCIIPSGQKVASCQTKSDVHYKLIFVILTKEHRFYTKLNFLFQVEENFYSGRHDAFYTAVKFTTSFRNIFKRLLKVWVPDENRTCCACSSRASA